MPIPKKQLSVIVELMEALPADGTQYETPPQIEFIPNDEVYIGYFDTSVINKMQAVGLVELIGVYDDERQALKIVQRDDFLSSWAAGVSEARIGSDLHYADYSNNQYAFTAGYEHWHNRKNKALKGKLVDYSSDIEYVCHGFKNAANGDIHFQ